MEHNQTSKAPRPCPVVETRNAVQQEVTKLSKETKEIDGLIKEVEIKAARESNEANVVELLDERARLVQRKKALPFLLRGVQSRSLYAQAEVLFAESEEVKTELDTAEADLQTAAARVPELRRQLDEATKAVEELTKQRDQLSQQYWALDRSAKYAKSDAGCIERGEPMRFEPDRFIGVVD